MKPNLRPSHFLIEKQQETKRIGASGIANGTANTIATSINLSAIIYCDDLKWIEKECCHHDHTTTNRPLVAKKKFSTGYQVSSWWQSASNRLLLLFLAIFLQSTSVYTATSAANRLARHFESLRLVDHKYDPSAILPTPTKTITSYPTNLGHSTTTKSQLDIPALGATPLAGPNQRGYLNRLKTLDIFTISPSLASPETHQPSSSDSSSSGINSISEEPEGSTRPASTTSYTLTDRVLRRALELDTSNSGQNSIGRIFNGNSHILTDDQERKYMPGSISYARSGIGILNDDGELNSSESRETLSSTMEPLKRGELPQTTIDKRLMEPEAGVALASLLVDDPNLGQPRELDGGAHNGSIAEYAGLNYDYHRRSSSLQSADLIATTKTIQATTATTTGQYHLDQQQQQQQQLPDIDSNRSLGVLLKNVSSGGSRQSIETPTIERSRRHQNMTGYNGIGNENLNLAAEHSVDQGAPSTQRDSASSGAELSQTDSHQYLAPTPSSPISETGNNNSSSIGPSSQQQHHNTSNHLDPLYVLFRDRSRFWIQRVLVPILTVIGLFGNSITMIIMTRRRMRSTTNLYLAALAFVDMLYLVLTFVLGLSHYPNMANKKYHAYWSMKPFLMMLTDSCSNTSVWLTVTFTIERYIAVRYPIQGKVWCTEARAKALIAGVFIFGIAFASPVPFEWRVVERRPTTETAPALPKSISILGTTAQPPDSSYMGASQIGTTITATGNGISHPDSTSNSGYTAKYNDANSAISQSIAQTSNMPTVIPTTTNYSSSSGSSSSSSGGSGSGGGDWTKDQDKQRARKGGTNGELLKQQDHGDVGGGDHRQSNNTTTDGGGKENNTMIDNTITDPNTTNASNGDDGVTLALDYSEFGENEMYKTCYYWSTAVIFYFIPFISLMFFNGYLIKSVHQSRKQRTKMTNQPKRAVKTKNCGQIYTQTLYAIDGPTDGNNQHQDQQDQRGGSPSNNGGLIATEPSAIGDEPILNGTSPLTFETNSGQKLTTTTTATTNTTTMNTTTMNTSRDELTSTPAKVRVNFIFKIIDRLSIRDNRPVLCTETMVGPAYEATSVGSNKASSTRVMFQLLDHPADGPYMVGSREKGDNGVRAGGGRDLCAPDTERDRDLSAQVSSSGSTVSITNPASKQTPLTAEVKLEIESNLSKDDHGEMIKKEKLLGPRDRANVSSSSRDSSPASTTRTPLNRARWQQQQQPQSQRQSNQPPPTASKQERRITIMLIAVVILFLLCQIPSAAMIIYTSVNAPEPNTNEHALVLAFGNIFNFLMAVNAAGNFVLYSFLSQKYRRTFVQLFCPCLKSGKQFNEADRNTRNGRAQYSQRAYKKSPARLFSNKSTTMVSCGDRATNMTLVLNAPPLPMTQRTVHTKEEDMRNRQRARHQFDSVRIGETDKLFGKTAPSDQLHVQVTNEPIITETILEQGEPVEDGNNNIGGAIVVIVDQTPSTSHTTFSDYGHPNVSSTTNECDTLIMRAMV